jgi:hypothetical protein
MRHEWSDAEQLLSSQEPEAMDLARTWMQIVELGPEGSGTFLYRPNVACIIVKVNNLTHKVNEHTCRSNPSQTPAFCRLGSGVNGTFIDRIFCESLIALVGLVRALSQRHRPNLSQKSVRTIFLPH